MIKNKTTISDNFYLKSGNYNKGMFDLTKVKLFDVGDECIEFNDVSWNKSEFLNKWGNDERLSNYLKKMNGRAGRLLEKERIEKQNKELISNMEWVQEYIFQMSKYNEVKPILINLFDSLDSLINKFSDYNKKTIENQQNLLKKRDALISKSLIILGITEENFVNFIGDKITGVFAKKLIQNIE